MGDYILFGKDEKHLSALDRKEITPPPRRYNSYKTKAEKNESLDALLSDPAYGPDLEAHARPADPDNKTRYFAPKHEIRRSVYDEKGNLIEKGDDFDAWGNPIPAMRELWASIDKWSERYDMYKGKIPPNEWVLSHPKSEYHIYKLGHILIDMRRHQYYIKDAYNPALHFFGIAPATKPNYDFCGDTGYWIPEEEWCSRKRHEPHLPQPPLHKAKRDEQGKLFWRVSSNTIDYENPRHICALLDNYVNLLRHSYATPGSDTRILCYDLELIIERANLSDLEQFLLEHRVAHHSAPIIAKWLREDDIDLPVVKIRELQRKIIPAKLANAAKEMRLDVEAKTRILDYLTCTKCNKLLPRHPYYFARSKEKKTGFCSQCKKCQKLSRERRRLLNEHNKQTQSVCEMQEGT